ncbi:MAG: Nif11-like leader peptide family natural product precursor [Nostoc sp.]|uniref:Nif11-like leader peptide family natural product precursor n=1 Tax=Nostoc sp. TaxID=1180 RepID=UPI002FF4A13F
MTVEAVSQFLKNAFEDDAILEEVAKAIESGGDREGVAQVAAKYGYQFTPEELGSSVEEMIADGAKIRQQSSELGESELDAVAGGTVGDILISSVPTADIYQNVLSKSTWLQQGMQAMTWNTGTKSPNW